MPHVPAALVQQGNKGEHMQIYLPCKLGEKFTAFKFKDWANGERIYENNSEPYVLTGFSKGLFYPQVYASGHIIGYDPTGKFGKDFECRYILSIPLGKEGALEDFGFPGKRKVMLYGLRYIEGQLKAEFITTDRYEHLYYPIQDTLIYSELGDKVLESEIVPY